MTDHLQNIMTKIAESVEYRGILGTLKTCMATAINPILNDERVIRYGERRFDRKFGTDTAGILPIEELHLEGPSAAHGIHYQASRPVVLKDALAGLRINYREFTLVDFGCGKGKALLLASDFPFKKIIGVELSPDLAQIARENLTRYKSTSQHCRSLEVVHMDATDFPLPPTPLVCYFYNPFQEPIMGRVLRNIEESLRAHPRELVVVYLYPELDYLFEQQSFLINVRRKEWCSVYRSNRGPILPTGEREEMEEDTEPQGSSVLALE